MFLLCFWFAISMVIGGVSASDSPGPDKIIVRLAFEQAGATIMPCGEPGPDDSRICAAHDLSFDEFRTAFEKGLVEGPAGPIIEPREDWAWKPGTWSAVYDLNRSEVTVVFSTDRLTASFAATAEAAEAPDSDEEITPAQLKRSYPPEWPRKTMAPGFSATVIVRGMIGVDGKVTDIEVLSCDRPGMGLEAAAIHALKRYRYKPARKRDGTPIVTGLTLAFEVR